MSNIYDAIIVGGGPAGLSAAIYLARAKFSVLVMDNDGFGGQIKITDEVKNYPGVFKTSGKALTKEMERQARAFGASFMSCNVLSLNMEGPIKRVLTDKGEYESVGLILATGSHPRRLGFKGESEYQGRGVAYCATCDGEFFTGKDIFVIGGGFAAAEEAIFLTKYGKSVTVVVRGSDFSCAKSIADKVKATPKINILYNTTIKEASGDELLRRVVLYDKKEDKEIVYETRDNFGVFVFAGYEPATALFKDKLELSTDGNLITDMDQKTNIDGVYGAGDVCVKNLRQIVTAVSDGAKASTSLEKYIPEIIKEHGLETIKLHVEEQEEEEESKVEDNKPESNGAFISAEIKKQLAPILQTIHDSLTFVVTDNGSSFSSELIGFANEFAALNSYLSTKVIKGEVPTIALYQGDKYLNISYHAVPGGHEFNSFVVAVFNAVGKGQPIDEGLKTEILGLGKINLKVFVSLSCTMCPEVVMGSQRIALINENVESEVYDIAKFPEYREKYDIMSVPALLINDNKLTFGKKDLATLVSLLK